MGYPAVVNLSLPKTGSTTIYSYFQKAGACHEGLHEKTVDWIIDYYEGNVSLDELKRLIARRQQYLKTNLDSSTFLHLIAAEIIDIYPESTLYITILRHPVEWAKSYLGMLYQFGQEIQQGSSPFDPGWASRYGNFQAKGLDPVRLHQSIEDREFLQDVIQELLQFWIDSELRIFDSVPSKQLAVFRLENLGEAIKAISKNYDSHLSLNSPPQKFNQATVDTGVKGLISRVFEESISRPLIDRSSRLYRELCCQEAC